MKRFQGRITEGRAVVVEAWEDGEFLPHDGSVVVGEFDSPEAALAAAEAALQAYLTWRGEEE